VIAVPVPIRIGVIVPPRPVSRLIPLIQSVELFVPSVVLLGPPSVGLVFVGVPLMIVVAFAVMISRTVLLVTLFATVFLRPAAFLPALVPLNPLSLLYGLVFLCALSWAVALVALYRLVFLSTLADLSPLILLLALPVLGCRFILCA